MKVAKIFMCGLMVAAVSVVLSGCISLHISANVPSGADPLSSAQSDSGSVNVSSQPEEDQQSSANNQLVGTKWVLSKVSSKGVELPSFTYRNLLKDASLVFDTDSSCTIQASDKSFNKNYTVSGNQITIGDNELSGKLEDGSIFLQYNDFSIVLKQE